MLRVTTLALTALSILMPCALCCTHDASTDIPLTAAAQTQPLQGSWNGVQKGQESAGKYTMTITGNSLHFQAPNPTEWYETTFTLPAGTDPKQLHATITGSPQPDDIGKVVFAIYKIEDETLTIVGFEGNAPPKTFEGGRSFRYDFKKAQPHAPRGPGR